MSDPKHTKVTVQPGTEVKAVTDATDAETVFVSGIQSVMMTTHTCTLSFYEQLLATDGAGGVVARHVINLAMGVDQIVAIVEHLNGILDDARDKAAAALEA